MHITERSKENEKRYLFLLQAREKFAEGLEMVPIQM
jgi:hypothetical protein